MQTIVFFTNFLIFSIMVKDVKVDAERQKTNEIIFILVVPTKFFVFNFFPVPEILEI